LLDIRERDARDSQRTVAPLAQAPDARLLDTTELSVGQAVSAVLRWFREQLGEPRQA
jgi:cytidylate kinase